MPLYVSIDWLIVKHYNNLQYKKTETKFSRVGVTFKKYPCRWD